MSKEKKDKKKKKVREDRFTMVGGPLHRERLALKTPGTLPFYLHGQYGYYDSESQWVALL